MSAKGKKQTPAVTILLIVIFAVLVVITRLAGGENRDDNKAQPISSAQDKLIVHFIDVGQGDCEFIELPDGECMLIDSGEKECADTVIDEIKTLGYTTIDYVVATHPHTDHIGAMSAVIDAFDVENIYMPKASTTTKTFERLLETISSKGLQINSAKAGVTVISENGLEVKFLAPVSTVYDDLNNYSAVLKITYGKDSYIFMGDAEEIVEKELLNVAYNDLDSDILKVGHHGSRYSSTNEFLNAVSPEYAIIELGENNSYGHPHKEAISRLSGAGAHILRTDELGSITITSNGDGNYDVDYRQN